MKSSIFRKYVKGWFAGFVFCLCCFVSRNFVKAEETLPVGEWKIQFLNGGSQTVHILADGRVDATTEPEQGSETPTAAVATATTGSARATDTEGAIEITYNEDRVELWSLSSSGDNYTVQQWHSISDQENGGRPAIGHAKKGDASPAKLEVHEWGTFTVLQGSTGQVIDWYQAPRELVDLPDFVVQPIWSLIAGKSGTQQFGAMDTVRMETPVLYFYPEKAMDVTVAASLEEGRITEVFPPAVHFRSGEVTTTWHGSLLPPNSAERRKIPEAEGPKGRHYTAARDVPEAWLFRNKPFVVGKKEEPKPETKPESAKGAKTAEPIDRFIFYRGAGRPHFAELQARQGKGSYTFTLDNFSKNTVPKLFALQVREGQTSWLTVDDLKGAQYEKGKQLNQKVITFPQTAGPADVVADELRGAVIDSLHAEGLTSEEATAMVNTWDNLWFTEPGTRVLAILPQATADRMVPLQILPTPTKVERVFVARIEILTREVEEELTSILIPSADTNQSDTQNAAARLAELQLGRYAAGGMERAADLIKTQVKNRFARLQQAGEEMKKLQARSVE